MDHSNTSILATLCYSDIFDYPLTKAELWRYLVTSKHISFKSFEKALIRLQYIQQKDKLFYLYGKSNLIAKRRTREKISEKKLQKANEIIQILKLIPTIEFIGISGSLAMRNAEKDADIDIFLITKKDTLWVTRLLVLFILQIKRVRRKREDRRSRNTFCVNMLVDSAHAAFPKSRHDIYTAHEIMQMKPLFSRGYSYEFFLSRNSWITKFLPNSFPNTALKKLKISKKQENSFMQIFEPIAKFIEIQYMKRHRSSETITKGFVAFHPTDYKNEVITSWEKKKKKYGI